MAELYRSEREQALVETARRVLPAGTFGNTSADIVIHAGRAGRVWDVSGNEYVDCLLGSGPMFAGHGHPDVLDAVRERDALLGRTLEWAGGTATGAGIDEHGRLLVDTGEGRQALNAGEVHLRTNLR